MKRTPAARSCSTSNSPPVPSTSLPEGSSPEVAAKASELASGLSESTIDVAAAALNPQLTILAMKLRRESFLSKYSWINSLIVHRVVARSSKIDPRPRRIGAAVSIAQMSLDWPPTFNVIYVPGTARALFDFARSLAEHSAYRFRLVSNACTADEEAFLAGEPQPSLGSSSARSRPRRCSLTARRCSGSSEVSARDTFACMDSDIFARGAFLTDAESLLGHHVALFSGLPMWQAPEERVMPGHFAFMSGRFSETDDGRCLGVSYCAIYRRAELETVMDRTGVTFHRRTWSELSREQRSLLAEMKLEKRSYDTVKLVNVMLMQAGLLARHVSRPQSRARRRTVERRAPAAELGGSNPRSPSRDRRIELAEHAASPSRVRTQDGAQRVSDAVVSRKTTSTTCSPAALSTAVPPSGSQRTCDEQLVETGRELLALRRRYEQIGRNE